MVHTEPRYTKDLDLWIEPVESNADKLFVALAQFGAPTADVRPSDFTEPEVFFQIGIEPVRIDIMTSVSGLDFVPAWERKVMVDFGGEPTPVLCRADVLKSPPAEFATAETRRDWRMNKLNLRGPARFALRRRAHRRGPTPPPITLDPATIVPPHAVAAKAGSCMRAETRRRHDCMTSGSLNNGSIGRSRPSKCCARLTSATKRVTSV